MARKVLLRRAEGERLSVLGATVRFMCRAEDTDGAWSIMENVIPRDAGPPPHRHAWGEGYYVLSGKVDFMVDGEAIALGPGDFLYAPANTVHGFRGASDEDTRMLVLDAPAHAEDFFVEVDRQVSAPADLPRVPAIGARHGIHFQPPEA